MLLKSLTIAALAGGALVLGQNAADAKVASHCPFVSWWSNGSNSWLNCRPQWSILMARLRRRIMESKTTLRTLSEQAREATISLRIPR